MRSRGANKRVCIDALKDLFFNVWKRLLRGRNGHDDGSITLADFLISESVDVVAKLCLFAEHDQKHYREELLKAGRDEHRARQLVHQWPAPHSGSRQ